MPQEHARPGVTHHLFDLIPHSRLVTVNGTFCTHGFIAPELASFQPGCGVVQQGAAMFAQRTATAVRPPAITCEHGLDRPQFPQSPWISHMFWHKSV